MILIREVDDSQRQEFDSKALHPLGSWEWGEFREKMGLKVLRLGVFDKKTLTASWQMTVHPIPKTDWTLIYFPKGPLPDQQMIDSLRKIGQEEKAIFVKMEPQVGGPIREKDQETEKGFEEIREFLLANGCKMGKSLFPRHTFWIDLTKKEEELMAQMRPKTRYNVGIAQRHGVKISEDNSDKAFKNYLALLQETTTRQSFYAHSPAYHQKMWETLYPSGMAHLLTATYQGKILTTWVLFNFNGVLYYPYGASSSEYREVMASNLMMWEAIKFGKKLDCHRFDLWGSLGPDASPSDPWFGFHHFKEGYNPQLVEFIGTYDLVLKPTLYSVYNFVDKIRWGFLKAKSRLPL